VLQLATTLELAVALQLMVTLFDNDGGQRYATL